MSIQAIKTSLLEVLADKDEVAKFESLNRAETKHETNGDAIAIQTSHRRLTSLIESKNLAYKNGKREEELELDLELVNEVHYFNAIWTG